MSKIEHPVTGGPQRGPISSGLMTGEADGAHYLIEQPNPGKRTVGIDLASADGWRAFDRLLENADVFRHQLLTPGLVSSLKPRAAACAALT
ncbi:hypothetical protein JMUB5695_00796 [Mycobacterium heckeshornense]|uniref:CoA transferase n=1 Tax=Mycobacterium heckeshornense TaxID=110505 RepID=UPI001AF57834|nr:CoA transferase [Mycobacterium heckeshornense]BCQ07375.1 hypothetical protein JMUB5695_00796 [Mycobacterium heckeshornense]